MTRNLGKSLLTISFHKEDVYQLVLQCTYNTLSLLCPTYEKNIAPDVSQHWAWGSENEQNPGPFWPICKNQVSLQKTEVTPEILLRKWLNTQSRYLHFRWKEWGTS